MPAEADPAGAASRPRDGTRDVEAAVAALAARLPRSLRPLARLASNYWWSWSPSGNALFARLDEERWERDRRNPVRLLQALDPARLAGHAADERLVAEIEALERAFDAACGPGYPTAPAAPRVYLCAEFGIHRSLPFYAGGLGILAGDFLKEASDQRQPVIGLGLFYADGSFHQRLDLGGWQHEHWIGTDSDRLPAVLVTGTDGAPLTVTALIRGRPVNVRVWRVDVGCVLLYLLDTDVPGNAPAERWITSRLYVGDRDLRLAQYAVLGIAGMRALRAMGVEPALVHLNEGHAALALVELLRQRVSRGLSLPAATEEVRRLTVFTTHTPVAAGNEALSEEELRRALPELPSTLGLSWPELLELGRVRPGDPSEPLGLTPLALRLSGAANGVSRLHGRVARTMWRDLWPGEPELEDRIGHVTNGVHLPTWMAPEMQALFDRFIPGWRAAPPDSDSWGRIDVIPDEALWEARCALRAHLAGFVREHSVTERLGRGESLAYAESAAARWSDDTLTIGFARRIATYKRLSMIIRQPQRAVALLTGPRPVQAVLAGKAHPKDDEAKRTVTTVFGVNDIPNLGAGVVFLEDYDIGLALELVRGCDLWLNVPRVTFEASGTSGMKSAANGGLQLSVLDGWWDEAYDGRNGWAVASDRALPAEEQDAQDAETVYRLLEHEVVPLFYDRDAGGIPRGWVQRMKASLRTIVPQHSASRMLRDYLARDGQRQDS